MFPLDTIVARAKRRGFVYPGSDIYGGLANAWDYGPYGSQLKKNISDLRWKTFIEQRDDMIGLDSQILMHPKVWEASGHVAGFNDPLIDDKKTGERFRADKLIEDKIERKRKEYERKIDSGEDVGESIKEYSFKLVYEKDALNRTVLEGIENYINDRVSHMPLSIMGPKRGTFSNEKGGTVELLFYTFASNRVKLPLILEDLENIKIVETSETKKLMSVQEAIEKSIILKLEVLAALVRQDFINNDLLLPNLIPESRSFEMMKSFIVKEIPNNPNTKKPAEWTDVRKFELMFYTYQGVIRDESSKIWMRPETAQGIFVNFKNVLDTTRMRVPFGIGQIGKAFRNEITPGNFLYRTREFEQMEIEYFVENDLEIGRKSHEMWKQESMKWWKEIIQLKAENVRFREHEKDELSHYSAGTFDVDYQFPWGWGELQGIAYRTDFDLTQHQKFSGKDMQYTDPQTGKRYIPHVIEPSFGLNRTMLAVLLDCYDEEQYTDANGESQTRVVVRFPKHLAPVKFAILPLIKKDDRQVEIAETLFKKLSKQWTCEYDDGGAIGKRYRRQDEIGTPYCITIDHQTVEDGTVTIRDRDSMEQTRISMNEITL